MSAVMMLRGGLWAVAGLVAFGCALSLTQGSERLLDGFADRSNAAAQSRWQARETAPPVRTAAGGGLFFDCPFGRLPDDRFYWDCDVELDLSDDTGISLDLAVAHPEAFRALMVYLRSGEGWYVWSRPLALAGRQRLYLARSDFKLEGKPLGWHRIDRIRFSPWRAAGAGDTRIQLHGLRAVKFPVLLVRGTLSAPDEGERGAARRAALTLERRLTALGVPYGVIDEDALTPAIAAAARLLILGYNPVLPDTVYATIEAFLERGGKVLVFYSSDARLARLMGFELGAYQAAQAPMQWSAFAFEDHDAWNVPPRVLQNSWNVRPVTPARPDARIMAWWEDSEGARTAQPAWTVSRNGAWMSHILQEGDNLAKEDLLAGLVTRWVPELHPILAAAMVARAERIGSYRSLTEAVGGLREKAASLALPARTRVADKLTQATGNHEQARQALRADRFGEAYRLARACTRLLTEAMALTMPPRPGEFRGVWDHHAVGWYPGDWERTARMLREAGVTAVFPNVAWGGLAHYASEGLPGSSTLERLGDQLESALRATRAQGLELHAWIVCWNLGGTPVAFRERMRREGRLQRDAQGLELAWLCPAHSDNQRHTLQIIREIAATRPHGVHLDYIRFPGADACFCETCRRAVESRLERALPDWPAVVRNAGPARDAWRQHRAETITAFVRQARQVVKDVNRDMLFSAAVFGGYPGVIDSIGQDWGAWLRDGVLDFAVPMNYTADPAVFRRWLREQQTGPASGKRLIPGIGVSSGEAPLTADQVLDQIAETRQAGMPGYMLFALDLELREHILPLLRLGPSASAPEGENELP